MYCLVVFFSLLRKSLRKPTKSAYPAPLLTNASHWFGPAFCAGPLTCHFGILTGDPRNPFLVSHLLVRFPHRKHLNDLVPSGRARPIDKASKKPLNSERGPREPKSDAKLQPVSDMAKSFHVLFQKKSPFSAFEVIRDTKMGVQDRTRSPRHPKNMENSRHGITGSHGISGITGINGITGISGISQPGSGIGRDRKG